VKEDPGERFTAPSPYYRQFADNVGAIKGGAVNRFPGEEVVCDPKFEHPKKKEISSELKYMFFLS